MAWQCQTQPELSGWLLNFISITKISNKCQILEEDCKEFQAAYINSEAKKGILWNTFPLHKYTLLHHGRYTQGSFHYRSLNWDDALTNQASASLWEVPWRSLQRVHQWVRMGTGESERETNRQLSSTKHQDMTSLTLHFSFFVSKTGIMHNSTERAKAVRMSFLRLLHFMLQ